MTKSYMFGAVAAMLLTTLPAAADTFRTFDVDVVLPHGSVTGTVTFDETSSLFTASALTAVLGGITYYFLPYAYNEYHYDNTAYTVAFVQDPDRLYPSQVYAAQLDVRLPVPTLANYQGSNICIGDSTGSCNDEDSYAYACYHGTGCYYEDATSGSFTAQPDVSAVPEPSSLLLLGTGLLTGSLAVARRRVAGA